MAYFEDADILEESTYLRDSILEAAQTKILKLAGQPRSW